MLLLGQQEQLGEDEAQGLQQKVLTDRKDISETSKSGVNKRECNGIRCCGVLEKLLNDGSRCEYLENDQDGVGMVESIL